MTEIKLQCQSKHPSLLCYYLVIYVDKIVVMETVFGGIPNASLQ